MQKLKHIGKGRVNSYFVAVDDDKNHSREMFHCSKIKSRFYGVHVCVSVYVCK